MTMTKVEAGTRSRDKNSTLILISSLCSSESHGRIVKFGIFWKKSSSFGDFSN